MMRIEKARALAMVSMMLLAAGCTGAAGDEALLEGEEVGSSEQALGSTNPTPTGITTWNDLVGMQAGGNYRLDADINASGKTWTPKDFNGTFDGAGKTISNLTINVSGDAGFFKYLNQAIVKNVKFTNLNVTGTWMVGGLASLAQDSRVERIAIEGTITATQGFAVGGIFGEMIGGTLFRSYAKGTARSAFYYAGGIAGFVGAGSDRGTITETYAQMTVSPDTSDAGRTVNAGGIVGRGVGLDIHDVYAVGNVTGRNGVGGIIGAIDCQNYQTWLVYKAIYRGGDVVDRNAPQGGWAGTIGTAGDCSTRIAHLWFDRTTDASSNWYNSSQTRGTTTELRAATSANSGIFCIQPNNCPNDNNLTDAVWDAGTSSQHHILKNMPGPNAQVR